MVGLQRVESEKKNWYESFFLTECSAAGLLKAVAAV
jgi:hypothetical protein